MTTAILAYKNIHSRVKTISLPKVNWKVVYCLGIIFCISLMVFYVISINQLTNGAYLIKNYTNELNSLSKENKIIEADFAESGFLNNIHKKVGELGFEKISKVKYIQIIDTSLAKAK